jgi:tryptophan synthase beta subunit
MPFGERGETEVEHDRLRLVQSKAIPGMIPQFQHMVAREFPEKIGEDRGDTRKVVLAIVGGEDLSRRLFGSMS